jgi:hypothetical protein
MRRIALVGPLIRVAVELTHTFELASTFIHFDSVLIICASQQGEGFKSAKKNNLKN